MFEGEKAGREKLRQQDWLTTVVEQDAGHKQAQVTGVMIDFITPGETEDIIEKLADPAIRIVSLTITEGGYFIDPASGKFNPGHPDIAADAKNIANRKTVFGLILAGLIRRREENLAPYTVMSVRQHPPQRACDVGRGGRAGRAGREGTRPMGADQRRLPNAMVDRITPATTDRERAILAKEFGVEDAWPVFCEPFMQWVLEDKFTAGGRRWRRPACSSSTTYRPSS